MARGDREIPGVVAPPPLIYATGLLLGWGLRGSGRDRGSR